MTKPSESGPLSNPRCIALVSGYHACSFPPPAVYDAGLKERFAVVLSSFRPDKDSTYFDVDLFVQLADAILRVIPHDSLDVEVDAGSPGLHSLAELTQWYARQDEMERDPPLRMRLRRGNQLVAIEETEFWVQVGGPAPYHDSYTLSFYTAENRVSEFRAACEAVCRNSGVTITAFHEAMVHKEPFVAWWRRPLRWLGVKPW